jgi:hypothetical protein
MRCYGDALQGGKGISMEAAPDKASSASGEEESGKQPPKLMQLEVHDWCGKWAIPSSEFDSGVVGAKSLNLQRLQVSRLLHFLLRRCICSEKKGPSNTDP